MNAPIPSNTFLQEAEDLLEQIESIALAIDPARPDTDAIHQLFRAFHTIKGSGAMFGFEAVAGFTHHVETALDKVRDGLVPLSAALVDLILASKDQIKALLEAAQSGADIQREAQDRIIAGLNALVSAPGQEQPASAARDSKQSASGSAATEKDEGAVRKYQIRFEPPAGLMASGTNPALLLDELRGLGQCTVKADLTGVPPLEQLQPDRCYLTWEIVLSTDRGLDAIKDVFIFVEDESKLSIQLVDETSSGEKPPTSSAELGQTTNSPKPQGDTVRSTLAAASPKATQEKAAAAIGKKALTKESTVRVPSERLDRLVALVGEMVMNQSRLSQVASTANVANLASPVEELERLVTELRDNVLGIRMLPIGATFSRFNRLVHDLSAELRKEIELVTEGGDTELDKTVLDQLADPLVHLIRNSIDHGIEPGEVREATGKPRQGTIRLAAAHMGSNVVVTIQDDGRGLDPDVIRAKAIEKQLIAADAKLSHEEIFNLIFLPGFSTAKQVTSVSGRGVGMDVVRRQIDTLRGSIQLASELGKGTTVSLTLPLTLAIIEGLLVEIERDQFIIPMAAVAENVELPRAARARHNGRNLIEVRGELVPYVSLRQEFAINGEAPGTEKVVIVRHGSERVGLVVDRVLGSHQTVIQSLGRFYRQIEVVSGATIMGDGRVALILDLGGVLRSFGSRSSSPSPTAAKLAA